MINQIMTQMMTVINELSTHFLLPLMCLALVGGAFIRWAIYFTMKSMNRFVMEFEKRVLKHLSGEGDLDEESFHALTKKVLENAYYEHFELRRKFHRRRFDQVTSFTDRMFLVCEGSVRLIKDTLSQTQYLKKDGKYPKFLEVSKFVFQSNPAFNRLFGILPTGLFNDLVNILPGLFVIGGIFGTFVGVMSGLPGLGGMDISNTENTQRLMNEFISHIAFSMGTSVFGILCSVILTIWNSIFSPDAVFLNTVNKFASTLEFLWNDTQTNEVAKDAFISNEARVDRRSAQSVRVTPPNPDVSQQKKVREIEQRIQMLDMYTKMAYEDRLTGVLSEELWLEKSEQWISEKRKLEEELKANRQKPVLKVA